MLVLIKAKVVKEETYFIVLLGVFFKLSHISLLLQSSTTFAFRFSFYSILFNYLIWARELLYDII